MWYMIHTVEGHAGSAAVVLIPMQSKPKQGGIGIHVVQDRWHFASSLKNWGSGVGIGPSEKLAKGQSVTHGEAPRCLRA